MVVKGPSLPGTRIRRIIHRRGLERPESFAEIGFEDVNGGAEAVLSDRPSRKTIAKTKYLHINWAANEFRDPER